MKIPRDVGVMILPNATLFPQAMLPLYIFEPRYREMLAWSLEQQRMFCVALMKPGLTEARTPDDFHHTVGLGLVRACVGHEDGTSHLILQGLVRVAFTGFVQISPFPIAEIRELPIASAKADEAATLSAIVLELCAQHRARDRKSNV